MSKFWFILAILLAGIAGTYAQSYTVFGRVIDNEGKALPGCHIHHKKLCNISDMNGSFSIDIGESPAILNISFLGFEPQEVEVKTGQVMPLQIQLFPSSEIVQEVSVKGNRIDTTKSRKNDVVSADFMMQNLSSTFVKTLERLPGVNAMDIGANASKPVIRGMGFNRVVVSENGIKQEGQQWGADHGLELDPFNIETAEIVKGASGIEYGSDAIGGYINITNDKVPEQHTLSGTASVLTKSVNGTIGASAYLQGRGDKHFFKARATILDYGDYRVPTDEIMYLSRKIPVYNQRLKNTAGKEYDGYFQWGYLGGNYKTSVTLSNVYQKSGFFPGAHGVPDIDRVQHDGNYRNIEYPYQLANHSKVLSNSKFFFDSGELFLDLAYQYNLRQEHSEFHTHYPNQPVPKKDPNLEFDFRLSTYTANIKYAINKPENHKLEIGIQNQYRDNQTAGYNFLLPEYTSYALGFFVKDAYRLSDKLTLNAGFRYDVSNVKTESYFDEILYNYFIEQGLSNEEAAFYAQRSTALNRNFGDYSWLLGLVYKPAEHWIARLNVGKAFRMPTAIELGSNGIHHGSFRHELGDPDLDSERGYYADANIEYNQKGFAISFSPYMYYFDNYLFLKPTGEWSQLPHAGQVYQYSQSEALLTGIEISSRKRLTSRMNAEFTLEYVYNKQLSPDPTQRYPLPFTPPLNGFFELGYAVLEQVKALSKARVFFNTRFTTEQSRVSRNEETTDGYVIFGGGFSTTVSWPNKNTELVLQGFNLLNTKYYNHMSFYRQVEIPEQGRNIQLMVKVPF
ncbi:TonB-dependent receptor [Labilibacter sediminis]|nr:TonB-dependent receptor [Labilibacter sediminis]